MRINLTKKDIINSVYMQLGFSKKVIESILNDMLDIISYNIIKKKKLIFPILALLSWDIKKKEREEIQKQRKLK